MIRSPLIDIFSDNKMRILPYQATILLDPFYTCSHDN